MQDKKLREYLGLEDDFEGGLENSYCLNGKLRELEDEVMGSRTEFYKLIDKLAEKIGYERVYKSAIPAEMTFEKKKK
jgi:hypothetical protein